MKLLCRLFGHKIDKDFTDSGYHVCKRCSMHEYYDSPTFKAEQGIKDKYDFYDDGVFLRPYYFLLEKTKKLKAFLKDKLRKKHIYEDDLPF